VSTLTILENVTATLTFQGVAAVSGARERARAMLERLEISAHAGLRPEETTREVRYRAAAARALAGEPELMILEDPLSALDDNGGQALVRTCQELCETVIVFDPRKEEALREVADHLIQDAFWGFQEDTEQMRIE
jgi:ABC-type lipoprotein export system ATPase subunit